MPFTGSSSSSVIS